MSKDKKERTLIYIDDDDYDFYKFLKQSHYFSDASIKNIDLFLFATLVGLRVVGKPTPLDTSNKKDYIRVNDNKNKESMIILKSLAISKYNNVNVLTDEDKLFTFCEGYANSGIKQINAWYNDNEDTFDNILIKELLKYWDEVDFDKLEE